MNKTIILLSGPVKKEKEFTKLIAHTVWHCKPTGKTAYNYAENQIARFRMSEDEIMIIHVGRNSSLARMLKDDFGLIHFGLGTNEDADFVDSPENLVKKIIFLSHSQGEM